MAMSWLSGLAAAGAVPVFPVVGENALSAAEDLALDPRMDFVATPRHAAILLVIGAMGEENIPDLHRVHDQLPQPRATVWWKSEPPPGFADPVQVAEEEDAAARIAATFRALVAGKRIIEPDFLPNEPPHPWRGKGDHGQGGKDMMGGTPYGRPMAMTADDIRDGLALDAYSAPFGPFLPMLPPGMVVDITLQGDVIQKAAMLRKPFPQRVGGEREELLRRIGRMLRLLGLAPQAERFFRAAQAQAVANSDNVDAGGLRRLVRWSGAVQAMPEGLGRFGSPPADARMRFSHWLDRAAGAGVELDAAEPLPGEDIGRLLTGLEWQEAMLAVNSIGIGALRRFPEAKAKEEESQADPHQREQHQHQHHGHAQDHDHHEGGHE